MSFMQKQVTDKQNWLQVETTHGTEIIPAEFVSSVSNCDEENVENMPAWFNLVQQYTEGEPQSWEWVRGHGARMSAPGYMDCTDWTVFDTVAEAESYLEEYYGEESESEQDSTED